MKLHATLAIAFLLQLAMLVRSQYPQPMPFGPPIGGPPIPMSMPMPMPMPMPMMPQQRMPMVVMPYPSKTADNFRRPKRKRPRKIYHDHESDSTSSSDSHSDSESSSDEMNFRASRGATKRRRQVLTPVVSYVTKDGYVVYQKKIRKDRAKDWLEMGKGSQSEPKEQSAEMTLRQLRGKLSSTKKKRRYHNHGHHGHD